MIPLKVVDMTPEDKFNAVASLKNSLEEDFVSIGELLSEIKRMRTFKIKGSKNFKEFVETEYNMSHAMANKLIGIYDFYIKDLDLQSERVQEVGIDKLTLIKPLIKDACFDVQMDWVKTAENKDYTELKEKIKVIRDKEREDSKTLKDVLVEQYLDNMKGFFNCSGKELNYKLALFFQRADIEEVLMIIQKEQRKFEEQIQGHDNGKA